MHVVVVHNATCRQPQELVGMEVVLVATGECIGTVAALYDGTGMPTW